jgi:hypothetical protein
MTRLNLPLIQHAISLFKHDTNFRKLPEKCQTLLGAFTIEHFSTVMEQHTLKNVNSLYNTNFYSYSVRSGG